MHGPRILSISQAVKCLREGRIIAYPTEAVYGLGCDPGNETAVRRLLALKNRPLEAGLILIADEFERFLPYIQPLTPALRDRAESTWPGPVTWLFPGSETVPRWLSGAHDTVALRVSAHPVCRALCATFGGPLVSTSANPRQQEPATSATQAAAYFGPALCGIVAGELGGDSRPSEIRDLVSGSVIREG